MKQSAKWLHTTSTMYNQLLLFYVVKYGDMRITDMENELTFTVSFMADHREVSGIHLSVTLKAEGLGDALYKAKLALIQDGYCNIEELSVSVAEDDVPLGIKNINM
ncbi:hypothetical protein BAB42_07235 [Salmonella enterica subsp. enterica serovar Poano]|nr:hypothetical protein [Salmonella enterica]EBW2601678.1 hypothetical protein [Salmonella enterica subsp. enterica serovar Poano]ECD2093616.1 hypothetical protein [Salmonella enterica subsp. enterica serovar Poano]ECE6544308.1 hypothetical protein [Salmonella enterica subsp. enterica]ECS5197644.1 hypothetical protein [Salmonella enterica subsp. enterica serovar Poano]